MKANIFALETDEPQEQTDEPQAETNDFIVPEILDQLTVEKIAEHYERVLPELQDNKFFLNFKDCRRIQFNGLIALTEFAEKIAITGRHIYIDHIKNDVFKALKITGKQNSFRFPHQGIYLSERFMSGGPRC